MVPPPPRPAEAEWRWRGKEQLSEKSGFAEMIDTDGVQKRVDLLDDYIQA
jgi:hypothetical protein